MKKELQTAPADNYPKTDPAVIDNIKRREEKQYRQPSVYDQPTDSDAEYDDYQRREKNRNPQGKTHIEIQFGGRNNK